jgi:hypothetical protein
MQRTMRQHASSHVSMPLLCVAFWPHLLWLLYARTGLLPQAVCTRWASDPMCYGSYSSVAVGSSGAADYEALAQPLGDRVFFAGEATTSR